MTYHYWNPEIECSDRTCTRELQSGRLRDTVRRCYATIPHYRRAFDAVGLRPDDITGVDDLPRLPFTTKDDLRDNYPYGLFSAPMEQIVRLHASSGTTGKPIVVGYTRDDIGIWSECMARTLAAGGVQEHDVVQVAYGYGLFTGGLGAHYGAERLGATVVPLSGGNTSRQVMLMRDFGATALACTPSFALFLAESIVRSGIPREEVRLKVGFFGAEPWSNAMRRDIEARLNIVALDIYGLSEIIGPGVAYECPCQNGLHVCDDHFLPEIVSPDNGKPLAEGECGELVFTTISRTGSPVIRYRTRDLSRLYTDPCPCGRTSARIERIMGRTDDMLIIRGVNVFPSQIEAALLDIGYIEPHYQIVVDRAAGQMDSMEVLVEMSESTFTDEIRRIEELERRLCQAIMNTLNIHARVRLVEPNSIPRSEGKARRVVDKRDLL